MSLKIWRKNPVTGKWKALRIVSDYNAEDVLDEYRAAEPGVIFTAAYRKPA